MSKTPAEQGHQKYVKEKPENFGLKLFLFQHICKFSIILEKWNFISHFSIVMTIVGGREIYRPDNLFTADLLNPKIKCEEMAIFKRFREPERSPKKQLLRIRRTECLLLPHTSSHSFRILGSCIFFSICVILPWEASSKTARAKHAFPLIILIRDLQ